MYLPKYLQVNSAAISDRDCALVKVLLWNMQLYHLVLHFLLAIASLKCAIMTAWVLGIVRISLWNQVIVINDNYLFIV